MKKYLSTLFLILLLPVLSYAGPRIWPGGSSGGSGGSGTLSGTATGSITIPNPYTLTLGTLTTGYIPFSVGGLLTGDSNLFWDNTNKRFGIGTVSPGSLLTVGSAGDTGLATTPTLRLQGYDIGSAGVGSYGGMIFSGSGTYTNGARRYLITNALALNKFAIIRSTDATTDPSIGASGVVGSGTADFVIDNSGNVGIGTTTPAHTLDVAGAGNFTGGVTASSFTTTKSTGVAGLSTVYEANASDVDYIGWMGPASIGESWSYQFSSTQPSAGQAMVFAVPTGTGDPNGKKISAQTWINPSILVVSGTATLGTSAISSGTCATVVSVAGTGITTTDVIDWGFNGDPTGVTGYVPSASGMLTIITYPTSGYVNFKVCNNTASPITPGAITLNWKVRR